MFFAPVTLLPQEGTNAMKLFNLIESGGKEYIHTYIIYMCVRITELLKRIF